MYVRDKRSPTPKNEAVSRVMSANRAKTAPLLPEEGGPRLADGVVGVPELTLRKALWRSGLRGYRLHRRIRTSGSVRVRTASDSDRVSSTRHSSLTTHHSAVRPDISFVGKSSPSLSTAAFGIAAPTAPTNCQRPTAHFGRERLWAYLNTGGL